MSLFQKVRATVLGHTNELLDKIIDLDSIPVVKQYVRDLEEALAKMNHEAAAAAAHVTTLTAKRDQITKNIELSKQRAAAFLARQDEASARVEAGKIHDAQEEASQINDEIVAAQQNSQMLDKAVASLTAKHDQMLHQVRLLESKDHSSKAMESATASLHQAESLSSLDVSNSVDNLSERINERAAVAQEEMSRTLGGFQQPADPIRESSIDDILKSIREPMAARG